MINKYNFCKKILSQKKSCINAYPVSKLQVHGININMITPANDNTLGSWIRGEKPFCKLMLGELELLMSLVKPQDFVLDAGANVGLYSILLAKKEPASKIYAFEPDPVNYALLLLNLHLNNISNVYCYQFALGNKDGHVPIYHNTGNIGDSRSFEPTKKDLNEGAFLLAPHKAKKVSLQTFLVAEQKNLFFDLVKIDTQGPDFQILETCAPLIKKGGHVVIEFSPYHIVQTGTSIDDIGKVLKQFETIKIVDYDRESKTSNITFEELSRVFEDGSCKYSGYSDLFLTK
jgi:FkbM family methyltransferase